MKQIVVQDLKKQFNIAVIVSRFNEEVTHALYEGASERLKELEFAADQVTVIWVPGAVEIPITAQRVAKTNAYEAIVCLGAIIREDTAHFDYVCQQVSRGCLQVSLQYEVPVIFGVLTTDNEAQAFARAGGEMGNKGREAIDAAFEIVSVLRQIDL